MSHISPTNQDLATLESETDQMLGYQTTVNIFDCWKIKLVAYL